MATVEERKNKNMPTVYRVRRYSRWHRKTFTLASFYSLNEAEQYRDEVKIKLKYDQDGSALLRLLEQKVENERRTETLQDVFAKHVASVKEYEAAVRGHLKAVRLALSKVLFKSEICELYIEDLLANYEKVFAVFEESGKKKTTQINRHMHVKNALRTYFGVSYKPLEVFGFTVDSKNTTHTFADEVRPTERVIKKLKSQCNPRLIRALTIETQIGCRFGPRELTEIKYSDLTKDEGQWFLEVTNAKRKKKANQQKQQEPTRLVPVSNIFVAQMRKWEAEDRENGKTTDYVINWGNKKCKHLNNAWGRAKKRSGMGEVQMRPYASRHVWVKNLLDNGVDPLAVAHMLGHTDTKMIEKIYGNDTSVRQLKALPILENSKFTKALIEE